MIPPFAVFLELLFREKLNSSFKTNYDRIHVVFMKLLRTNSSSQINIVSRKNLDIVKNRIWLLGIDEDV